MCDVLFSAARSAALSPRKEVPSLISISSSHPADIFLVLPELDLLPLMSVIFPPQNNSPSWVLPPHRAMLFPSVSIGSGLFIMPLVKLLGSFIPAFAEALGAGVMRQFLSFLRWQPSRPPSSHYHCQPPFPAAFHLPCSIHQATKANLVFTSGESMKGRRGSGTILRAKNAHAMQLAISLFFFIFRMAESWCLGRQVDLGTAL